ncbi:DUF5337 domain-containing protein [Sulfitobacter sp. S190]|uniref:DUF5337 domain-containing protein n=1 Tax=Sulfitobacter sp. S190 TaxID=2867022 RepID=UPI0021A6B941|nr:DUF5337 domain-containing protein [Sulfitobacter sp. S190]UWR23690.1 DUF5337 domain-containing protein [Sulfitobacter sp. S190]
MRDKDDELSRKGRRLALVSVACAFTFMAIEFLGAAYGWPNNVMGLLELGIAAVFLWVMVQSYMLWRQRQRDENG